MPARLGGLRGGVLGRRATLRRHGGVCARDRAGVRGFHRAQLGLATGGRRFDERGFSPSALLGRPRRGGFGGRALAGLHRRVVFSACAHLRSGACPGFRRDPTPCRLARNRFGLRPRGRLGECARVFQRPRVRSVVRILLRAHPRDGCRRGPLFGFGSTARPVELFRFGERLEARGFRGTRLEAQPRLGGRRFVGFGARAQLGGAARLDLGVAACRRLARGDRLGFDPCAHFERGALLGLGVYELDPSEFLFESRPFLVDRARRGIERLSHAQRLDCARIRLRALFGLLRGRVLGTREGLGERACARLGIGPRLGGGACARFGGGARRDDLLGVNLRTHARFGFPQQPALGRFQIGAGVRARGIGRRERRERARLLGGRFGQVLLVAEDRLPDRVERGAHGFAAGVRVLLGRRPPLIGVRIECEPQAGRFRDGHGRLLDYSVVRVPARRGRLSGPRGRIVAPEPRALQQQNRGTA